MRSISNNRQFLLILGSLSLSGSIAFGQITTEPSMLDTTSSATNTGWSSTPVFTVGETIQGYQPVGILDGVGAFPIGADRIKVLVNHELGQNVGYAYALANGTQLTGARVSCFEIQRQIDSNGVPVYGLLNAGPAYDAIVDRNYTLVTNPAQVNETGNAIDGFARFCSAQSVLANTYGFGEAIYLTGEETGTPFHPHGGSLWALQVDRSAIWAVPAAGRGAWENVTPLETGNANTIALLLGDDTEGAPLYLFVGQKNAFGSSRFLDVNGFLDGKLYAWKADNGDLSPQQFNGESASRKGQFVEVPVRDITKAGQAGYDAAGYLDDVTIRAAATALGCFSFSRPEDLATNPLDGTQAVFASTGRGSLFPADNWGTVYVVDVDFSDLSCDLVILHDADGLADPDTGIRSPDNLEWSRNGKIYLQEDRSTTPSNLFGASTGIEASIWELDPITHNIERCATVDRTVVVPAGTTDSGAGQIGHWETSGILDVTNLLPTLAGERLLIGTVQAHGIKDGAIGGSSLLVEGGQLFFLSKIGD